MPASNHAHTPCTLFRPCDAWHASLLKRQWHHHHRQAAAMQRKHGDTLRRTSSIQFAALQPPRQLLTNGQQAPLCVQQRVMHHSYSNTAQQRRYPTGTCLFYTHACVTPLPTLHKQCSSYRISTKVAGPSTLQSPCTRWLVTGRYSVLQALQIPLSMSILYHKHPAQSQLLSLGLPCCGGPCGPSVRLRTTRSSLGLTSSWKSNAWKRSWRRTSLPSRSL